ncbi:MAG: hypothetical protein NTZ05_21720, partial [Chloroflexi bacterium]|nr:hypothetical protein [Chloroflexota bacterium]
AFYMYTLLFGLMIFFIAKDGGFITRILKHPYLVLLGEASFSLYMIHFFPLILLRTMYRDTMPAVIIPLLVMLLTVAASVICYKYIENPSRLFLNNRFR